MSMLRVAATQMACSWDLPANLDRAENLIREAAAGVTQVIPASKTGIRITARSAQEFAIQDSAYALTFCGHSFNADHTRDIVVQVDNHSESVLLHEFDMEMIRCFRDAWGIFRDRRPDLYQTISTLDGKLEPC